MNGIPEWEAIHRDQSWGRWPSEQFVRFASPRAPEPEVGRGDIHIPPRVVELGCGAGAQLRLLIELGFEVVGLDISPTAIEKAKSLLGLAIGSRAEVSVFDLTTGLPFEDGSVDGIVDVQCLMCFPWEIALAIMSECTRVLKPGGWLYSECIGAETDVGGEPSARVGEWKNTIIEGRVRNRFLRTTTKSEITSLMEGLQIDKVDRVTYETVGGCDWVGERFVSYVVHARKAG